MKKISLQQLAEIQPEYQAEIMLGIAMEKIKKNAVHFHAAVNHEDGLTLPVHSKHIPHDIDSVEVEEAEKAFTLLVGKLNAKFSDIEFVQSKTKANFGTNLMCSITKSN